MVVPQDKDHGTRPFVDFADLTSKFLPQTHPQEAQKPAQETSRPNGFEGRSDLAVDGIIEATTKRTDKPDLDKKEHWHRWPVESKLTPRNYDHGN